MTALKRQALRAACVGMSCTFGLAVAAPVGKPPHRSPEAALLSLTQSQKRHLCRIVRRAMRDEVLGRPLYEPEYVPASLAALEAEVVVSLRQSGHLRSAVAGGPAPLATATRDAAVAAVRGIGKRGVDAIDLLDEILVEIEVVAPAEPIDAPPNWTAPRALDPFVEPGIHGIVLRNARVQHRYCPSEFFTGDKTLAVAIERAARRMASTPDQLKGVELMRFRTVHWYQPPRSDTVVSLVRGLTLVPQDAVTPHHLRDAVDRLADYMVYRQQASGLFAYQYEPGLDVYTDADNLVRQAGAAAAVALHARWSHKSASVAAADRAVDRLLAWRTDAPGRPDAAFIATPDGRNKLGVTALVCIALAEHPDARRYADARQRLVNGMLWLQRPSGMFITAFPPAESIGGQAYFPGEALLALAAHYDHTPSAEVLEAFDRAIAFYRTLFRDDPSPAFVPWQVQAYAHMAHQTRRRDYVDYVFELTDSLADKQITPADSPWPDMYGGIASYQPGRAGVSTASYLEAFADALRLARSVGDTARAERYETVVRRAARFVMQLQVRPEEAYFIRSPQDAVGGIRTAPALNLLRIDHCQHALVALIKTIDVLFPGPD
ncbi:MAG: hypothetical protein ACE5E6_06570 [Phycisphaerae bacterium]